MQHLRTRRVGDDEDSWCGDFATRLLLVQRRIDALDRPYNQELAGLQRWLSQLQAEFLREVRQPQAASGGKSARRTTSSRGNSAGRPARDRGVPEG